MPPDASLAISDTSFDEFLLARGALSAAAFERARRLQSETAERFGSIVLKLGLISERDLANAYAEYTKLPLLAAAEFPESPVLPEKLSKKFLKQAGVLPVAQSADGVVLAVGDPLDRDAIDTIGYALDAPVDCKIALPSEIAKAFERLYESGSTKTEQLVARFDGASGDNRSDDAERLKDLASEAPVIRLVNHWVESAIEAHASDIHVESADDSLHVRFRVDGGLRAIERLPPQLGPAVSSRIKIMARLDIAERRLPQDGKFRLAVRGRDIDFRVSVIPTVHGEGIVLRILDRSQVALEFEPLGFDEAVLQRYLSVLRRPHGILLVTGPTGSGKTTTLYTSLIDLRAPNVKILTIEDPVEYQLEGVNQTQVHPQIGLNFAAALRSFLRHDPDVILVGEIRDGETARIAVQAALTGHLVLSTLHTNDAGSAVTRLLDMGVDDYLIASTVNGIAAQRLVRRLCPHCREGYEAPPELAARLGAHANDAPTKLFRPKGCERCGGSGFAGRVAILEVLVMTERLRAAVMERAPADEILRTAEAEGMKTMLRDGVRKCLAGLTTFDEVLRATSNL